MPRRTSAGLDLLSTGVPGLDEILGGGLPEYSFNLVAGPPGSGKTTLAHQITFANATEERPALYFTVLGEPSLKMLRYQKQMEFFDPEKVGSVIRFLDLSEVVLQGSLARVLDAIVGRVESSNPGIVVVDSFRTVLRAPHAPAPDGDPQSFLQQLALHLASWQITSFLVGEYGPPEMHENPVFTIADGIFWLSQSQERHAVVRQIQAVKVRGMPTVAGVHTFRISSSGLQVFPRSHPRPERPVPRRSGRVPTGVPGLDGILGGGVPEGDVTLVSGPSGSGKTALGIQFLAEGIRRREPGVLAILAEHPDDYLARASTMGTELSTARERGQLQVVDLRPMDLSADEILHSIREAIGRVGARRLVIDSLNGLELILTPDYRENLREALYRMIGSLAGSGVSVVMTAELPESSDRFHFSPHTVSFLAQNILFMRYVELEGQLRKVMAVVKMRRSDHSTSLHAYEVTERGVEVREALTSYRGILTGIPEPLGTHGIPGLPAAETALLDRLLAAGEASAEELATDTGLDADQVERGLRRLSDLGHVLSVGAGSGATYRAARRRLGR